jgi:hypothetical protein
MKEKSCIATFDWDFGICVGGLGRNRVYSITKCTLRFLSHFKLCLFLLSLCLVCLTTDMQGWGKFNMMKSTEEEKKPALLKRESLIISSYQQLSPKQ